MPTCRVPRWVPGDCKGPGKCERAVAGLLVAHYGQCLRLLVPPRNVISATWPSWTSSCPSPARASSPCGTATAARRWSLPSPRGRPQRPRRFGPPRSGPHALSPADPDGSLLSLSQLWAGPDPTALTFPIGGARCCSRAAAACCDGPLSAAVALLVINTLRK